MRSSNQTGRTSSAPRKSSGNKTLTIIGSAIIVVALLIMSVFSLSSFAGKNKRNPIVLFVGTEGNFPRASMTNTLHASGFNYEFGEVGDELDSEEKYVIAAVGDTSIDAINTYKDNDAVLGFVLICPAIRDGQSLDDINCSYPDKDIAIFAGKDNANEVSSIGDARVLYERISGVDTVYGVGIKRGGLFASKCFVNISQNRYLSLSYLKFENGNLMLFSPLFQNELAGYLGVTYENDTIHDVSFSRINFWFVIMLFSIFAWIFGEALYLSVLPIVMRDNVNTKISNLEKLAIGFVGGISLASIIGILAMSFADSLHGYITLLLLFLPIVMMVLMVIPRIGFIINKESGRFEPKGKFIRPLFMAVTEALFVILIAFSYGDLKVKFNFPLYAIVAAGIMVDSVVTALLLHSDRKARSLGQGGCSYFGNAFILPIMLAPSVFAFLFGLIFGESSILLSGIGGLLITAIPYVALIPIRRHSDNTLIPSLLHGIVFTVLFVLIA